MTGGKGCILFIEFDHDIQNEINFKRETKFDNTLNPSLFLMLYIIIHEKSDDSSSTVDPYYAFHVSLPYNLWQYVISATPFRPLPSTVRMDGFPIALIPGDFAVSGPERQSNP